MDQKTKPNFWALTPLIVFLSIYLIASIIMGDFYKMPITVAFLASSIVAVAISSGGQLHKRIDLFCKGAYNRENETYNFLKRNVQFSLFFHPIKAKAFNHHLSGN